MNGRSRIIRVKPVCIECGALAEKVSGARIYPHRPDLHAKPFFLCTCGAYVGCHPETDIPLGKPGGAETRAASSDAHRVFDALWKRKAERGDCGLGKARGKAYRWLAEQLGVDPTDCHISWFDAAMCRRVVEVCTPYSKGAA